MANLILLFLAVSAIAIAYFLVRSEMRNRRAGAKQANAKPGKQDIAEQQKVVVTAPAAEPPAAKSLAVEPLPSPLLPDAAPLVSAGTAESPRSPELRKDTAGSKDVALPLASDRISSTPAVVHADSADEKKIVATPTLQNKVSVPEAQIIAGEGHVPLSAGKENLKASETTLVKTLQSNVHKNQHVKWPRAETPTAYIAMGFNESLDEAVSLATRNMVDFLITEKHLSSDEAYKLASVALDLHVTELVDGSKGVHAILPKNIFIDSKSK